MSSDSKVLSKYTEIIKDFAFIIMLIVGLAAGWFKLQSDVERTKEAIEHLQKESDGIVNTIGEFSKRTSDNETSIKVIETQLELIGGNR